MRRSANAQLRLGCMRVSKQGKGHRLLGLFKADSDTSPLVAQGELVLPKSMVPCLPSVPKVSHGAQYGRKLRLAS